MSGGELKPGDVLVTNFNSAAGGQGTGTTLSLITPSNPANPPATFFSSPAQGVTTPPVILKSGLVVVGNVPAGPNGTIGQGSIQFIDKNGNLVKTLTNAHFLNDPWNLAVNDFGNFVQLFISNVSGTTGNNGSVTRIDMLIHNGKPFVLDMVRIASGYRTRLDSAALVIGTSGLAFDQQSDTLYVAAEDQLVKGVETGSVYAIHNAAISFFDHGLGSVVYADPVHLHGPMGLALAPNGDLMTANADAVNVDPNQPSELVEFTKGGKFVSEYSVDAVPASAFALAFGTIDGKLSLAAVDDNTNTLDVWTLPTPGHSAAAAAMNGPPDGSDKHAAAVDAVLASLLEHDG